MIKSYLKIMFRNIAGHKVYSAINILGLSVGLACCLAISLFVYQELSYDRHYENADRIYRIGRIMGEGSNNSVSTPYVLAPILEQEFPEFELITRYAIFSSYLSGGGQIFAEPNIGFADNSFFEIFDLQWLAGDPEQALSIPSSIVLTETLARKYFGNADPMGQVLLLNGQYPLQVTGLTADLPVNTHIRAQAWGAMDMFETLYLDEGMDINVWNFASVSTYAMLVDGTDIGSLDGRFAEFVSRHVPENVSQNVSLSADNITAIHMSARSRFSTLSPTAKVLISSAIALCILFIAVVNFLNLSIARSLGRAREVGIRKSLGASRGQLIYQFLTESLVMTVAAMLVAAGLVEVFLPLVNQVLGLQLTLAYVTEPWFFIGVIVFTLVLSVVVGYYPAIHLSAYQVSSIIKGERRNGRSGVFLRNNLVILQFTISIALIVSAVVIFQQMNLARSIDLGFNQDQVLVFQLPLEEEMDINTSWGAFKNQLLSNPGITSVTHSVYSPVQGGRMDIGLSNQDKSVEKAFSVFWIEPDYFNTYQIDLLAGRTFTENLASDLSRFDPEIPGSVQGSVVLSDQAARDFGWTPQEAIGQLIERGSGGGWVTVIGVVANTVSSAKEGVESSVYVMPETYNYSFMRGVVAARMSGASLEQTLGQLDTTWNQFVSNEPIDRRFLDDEIEALYQQEQLQMGMFALSALLAVLIACFGLYGLAAFNTERRTKEIGVRKVMGGTVWNIVLLLTNDFSRLVLLSNIIAWPVAYFAMNRWLENFAYRIDLTPMIFIGSGLIALCIAWVTVGGTAAKAASRKPVLALRYE